MNSRIKEIRKEEDIINLKRGDLVVAIVCGKDRFRGVVMYDKVCDGAHLFYGRERNIGDIIEVLSEIESIVFRDGKLIFMEDAQKTRLKYEQNSEGIQSRYEVRNAELKGVGL